MPQCTHEPGWAHRPETAAQSASLAPQGAQQGRVVPAPLLHRHCNLAVLRPAKLNKTERNWYEFRFRPERTANVAWKVIDNRFHGALWRVLARFGAFGTHFWARAGKRQADAHRSVSRAQSATGSYRQWCAWDGVAGSGNGADGPGAGTAAPGLWSSPGLGLRWHYGYIA